MIAVYRALDTTSFVLITNPQNGQATALDAIEQQTKITKLKRVILL